MSTAVTPEAEAVLDQALKLSTADRDWIALRLVESINPPPNVYESDEALWAEIKRRIEAVENGTMRTYTLGEAMAKIRRDREGRPS